MSDVRKETSGHRAAVGQLDSDVSDVITQLQRLGIVRRRRCLAAVQLDDERVVCSGERTGNIATLPTAADDDR